MTFRTVKPSVAAKEHGQVAMTPPLTPAGQALLDVLARLDTQDQQRGDTTRPVIRSVRTAHVYEALPAIERQAADRALAELRREVEGLRQCADAALTDVVYHHGSDFSWVEWPGVAALHAELAKWRDKASKPEASDG